MLVSIEGLALGQVILLLQAKILRDVLSRCFIRGSRITIDQLGSYRSDQASVKALKEPLL